MRYWSYLRRQLAWATAGVTLILFTSTSIRGLLASTVVLAGAGLIAYFEYRDSDRKSDGSQVEAGVPNRS